MMCYINDGWSSVVREDSKVIFDNHVVKRPGKLRHEFLLERAILRWRRPNGEEDIHMLFGAMRGLKVGKKATSVVSASAGVCLTLRAAGHAGAAVGGRRGAPRQGHEL